MAEEEIVEGTALEVYEGQPPATLFRTDDPAEVVLRATQTADALMGAVRAHDAKQSDKAKKLISNIQGREFPKVECWTLLGTMLGVFPVCVWTRKLDDGWEARVEAHTLGGQVVGAAEAQCARSENSWRNRDEYAIRSMAQTRATSKALRVPLGFVMILAGLEATPAEEMPNGNAHTVPQATADHPEPGKTKMATDRQKTAIGALHAKLIAAGAFSEEEYRHALESEYQATSATGLTAAQASNLIERLKLKEKEVFLLQPDAEVDRIAAETITGPATA